MSAKSDKERTGKLREQSSSVVHIIEDDPDFGAYLEEMLEDTGLANVRLYADGLVGLRAALREVPDVLVLDLNLPSMRGEEICRLLRSSPLHRSIRILVCSDMPEAQKREMELLSIGADVYFQKPFVEERFIEDLQRLLRSGRRPSPSPLTDEETISRDVEAEKRAWKESQDAIALEVGCPRKPKGPPPQFSGYSILKVIGGGAMGTVYKARDEKNDRLVALKVFLRDPSDTSDSFERFQREALIMRELDHPSIVKVYETGHTGFTYYISMEFMDGGSLIDFPESRIDEDFVARAICKAGSALVYMHSKGVIHRDIKPGNILLGKDGSVKLGDFGISRAHLEVDRREFTSQEMLIGTRVYMAPELFMGGKADELTDQYAFGRTILRLFEGDHASMPPKELKQLGKPFSVEFSDALAQCMAIDRAQRYGSIQEACQHLMQALGRPFNP
ncbi:MAG: hypothetical protein PWP23_1955 [Candidatus Sumerlaeota bacterium]|nr:hypothetical protein [Candidatus Sumerlaeota bacterium]